MIENGGEVFTNKDRRGLAGRIKQYLARSILTSLPQEKLGGVETALLSMVEPDIFELEINQRIRQKQLHEPDQDEAIKHWIMGTTQESMKRVPLYKKISTALSDGAKEANIISKLAMIRLGSKIRTRVPVVGDFLIDTPVKMRLLEDIQYALSRTSDESEKQSLVREVVEFYGVGPQAVRTFQHPDFLPRLATSLVLNRTYYEGSRQILGWGAFGTLLFAPGVSDYFRKMVDVYGAEQATAAGAGILAGLGMVRMGVDCYVLKKRAMTPDVVELFLGLTSGQVDKQGKLRANLRWGLIGAPLDIWISSAWPPYSLAWGVAVPYSIPAYLLAMAVDQITFMGANLFYPKMVEWKDKLVRKISHEPKSD